MTVPVIIDIIAAVLLIGFAIGGARRGLFRALAGLLIVALALTGAKFAAETLSPRAAALVAPIVERQIGERVDEALEDTADQLPRDLLPEELLGLLGIGGQRLEALSERAREAIRETGVSILTAVARSMAESFLYSLIFILTFVLLTVLLRLIARVTDLALKLPVLHTANALGGAVMGLAEGALLVWLLTLLLAGLGVSPEGSHLLQFASRH